MFVDTHAHLADPCFASDLTQVLLRAAENSVHRIVCVSENASEARRVLDLAQQHDQICAAVGLHPESVCKMNDDDADAECAELERIVSSHTSDIYAVAEIGLDYKPHVLAEAVGDIDSCKKRQLKVFERLLHLAARYNLPVSVHSRGAGRHALAALESANVPELRVVFHAFDGRAVYAERAINSRKEGTMFFSVPANITRDAQMQKLVTRLPDRCLLLESDAPALCAVQGERNEPGAIAQVVTTIANLKQLDKATTERELLENTRTWNERLVGSISS